MSEYRRVPASTLLRVFWRCLFLQASWNRRGMQNLGFAYSIDPALRRLYPDPVARRDALRRHLGLFNCHPYMASAIVGGAILPVIQGVIADHVGLHHAFVLPLICYLYILFYALSGSKPDSQRHTTA